MHVDFYGEKAVYTLTVSVEPREPVAGEPCKIKGKLTKDDKPIPNAKVVIYIFKGTEQEAQLETKTDENGEYEVEYTFPTPSYRSIYAEAEFEEKPAVAVPKIAISPELMMVGAIAFFTALGLILIKKKKRFG